jgi:NDP-sugar pyrophosphorylase family protein
MRALIVAAGLGTRLRPLTESRAKPSLPVLGVPAFFFAAWHLAKRLGVKEIALNKSHAAESLVQAAGDAQLLRACGLKGFHFSDETAQVLGSSGALWNLKSWIGSSVLAVCHGDAICLPPWERLARLHREKGAAVTMHLRSFNGATEEKYTDVRMAEDGRVTEFGPKSSSGLMFSGAYLIEPSLLSRLPAGASELRPSLLEPLAKEGRLFALREDGPWLDIGSPRLYAEAQFALLRELPAARELVELKMREQGTNCWVPKTWSKPRAAGEGLDLRGPVVLMGGEDRWAEISREYGPRFAGIEPPTKGAKDSLGKRDSMVFGDFTLKL